jgi:hypothetical protein
MSFEAMRWAMSQHAPSSPSKFVLVALANAAHVEDWLAWPSIAYLTSTTQQDRKTVMSNLRKLEIAGLIQRTGLTGKTGQVIVWKLSVDEPDSSANSTEIGTSTKNGTGTNFPAKQYQKRDGDQYQKRDTEPVKEPIKEPVVRATRAHAADRGSRLPDDWTLPDTWRAWCEQHRPDLNPQDTADAFRDYWHGAPGAKGRKADWFATWRNWCRNQRKQPTPRMAVPDTGLSGTDEQFFLEGAA